MMRRPCIEECNQLSEPGEARCEGHLKQRGRVKNQRRATLSPANGPGQQLRRAINRAGGGPCAQCQGTYPARQLEVDHVTPLEDGGPDTWANVQALCHPCHATKTQDENRERNTARR